MANPEVSPEWGRYQQKMSDYKDFLKVIADIKPHLKNINEIMFQNEFAKDCLDLKIEDGKFVLFLKDDNIIDKMFRGK